MNLSRRALLGTAASLLAAPAAVAAVAAAAVYRDARAPTRMRVRDLLGQMTLEEKAAQLCCLWYSKSKILDVETGAFSPEKAAAALPNGIGHIGRPSDTAGAKRYFTESFRTPEDAVAFINAVQRYAVEKTRLGIPVIFHEETAHGLATNGATSFPIPTALASTWDPPLLEEIFTFVARQARARGVGVGLSPVLDLIRDPRWGRSEEFFGEDSFLVGEMATASVKGLQGPTRPIASDRILATLKHFVHGAPQGGLNLGPADMSERTLREVYLPPFQKAIRDGGAAIIMPSYNEVAGIPSHANRALLQQTGREFLGFEGAYFSDYGAIDQLVTLHRMAADRKEAAVLAMRAGVDVDFPEGDCYAHLPELVRQGRVPAEALDAAVARVLALKFELGLFESPYVDPAKAAWVLRDPAGSALARKAAQRSIVLLKNDGVLPLGVDEPLKVALIGPNSVHPMLGGYSGRPASAVGVLEGLKAAAGARVTIEQSDGVWITKPNKPGARPETGTVRLVPPEENAARIAEAVAVARRADVVILVVGDNEQVTRETIAAGFPGDRNTLGLFGDQDALVEAVVATKKPVVGVLINGRPLAVNRLAEAANALVEGWYLGEQGGHALADVLFGKVNPGGKLTVSFPRSVGELPVWYNRHPSADTYPYVEGKRRPLFAFGHGLSYTTFEISAPVLDRGEIRAGEPVKVAVEVANTGERDGDEVVQVYVGDAVSSVPRPILELKAFRRVSLKKGERKTVSFVLDAEAFALWDADMKRTVEPGAFTIAVGASLAQLKRTSLLVGMTAG
jgi:beta-glucosidase